MTATSPHGTPGSAPGPAPATAPAAAPGTALRGAPGDAAEGPTGTAVDAHHHLWDLTVRPRPWIDPDTMSAINRSFAVDELAPLAKASGIGRTVLVQTVDEVAETRDYLRLAAHSDLVAAVTGWVDLTAPDVAEQLAELRSGVGGDRLRGIRHGVQSEPDPAWLTRPDVLTGLGTVGSAGLVYELLTLPDQLPAAILASRRLPELSFVLDHCSKPLIADGVLEPWASRIRELAAQPNVTCKLSGLVTEARWDSWEVATLRPYAEVVLEAFGADRVMFGSDWPVCTLATGYQRWVETVRQLISEASPDEQSAIWSGTATRIYGL